MRDRLCGGGVVDEYVEPTPFVETGLHQPLAIGILRDVALHGDGIAAGGLAGRYDRLRPFFIARVVHHHVAPARRQHLGAFRADAVIRACSGDDARRSFEFQPDLPWRLSCSICVSFRRPWPSVLRAGLRLIAVRPRSARRCAEQIRDCAAWLHRETPGPSWWRRMPDARHRPDRAARREASAMAGRSPGWTRGTRGCRAARPS